MYWKCVLNISHHCSGLSVLTNICIGFGEYCGWTLGKTQENISALFHMHVGLLKCMNHRLWNLSSPATRVFVQHVVRATIKDASKSACRKCFHFGHRWIPLSKVTDAELWYFLWSAPEQMVELTIEMPVIWDAVALIMTSETDNTISLQKSWIGH